ncbi:hypothetical protein [Nocardia sp. IFM 10818]
MIASSPTPVSGAGALSPLVGVNRSAKDVVVAPVPAIGALIVREISATRDMGPVAGMAGPAGTGSSKVMMHVSPAVTSLPEAY